VVVVMVVVAVIVVVAGVVVMFMMEFKSGMWNRKHQFELSAQLPLQETMDLLQDILHSEWW
jgi:flagellar basal body-associated protein FliL